MSTTNFPTGGRELVERMTRKFPELFVNVDEEQRKLTRKLNEQFAFVYGKQWGGKKRAGVSDAMQSKDSMAVLESDGTISIWDMFSSGLDILVHDGQPPNFPNDSPDNSTFMQVMPVNWLGDVDPEPGPDPNPEPDPELEARVEELEGRTDAHADVLIQHGDQIAALHTAVAVLTNRVKQLETEAAKPLRVIGRTGDNWSHSHPIALDVKR